MTIDYDKFSSGLAGKVSDKVSASARARTEVIVDVLHENIKDRMKQLADKGLINEETAEAILQTVVDSWHDGFGCAMRSLGAMLEEGRRK